MIEPNDSHTIMNRPLKVLFLCTGNSCRSQMAEGWARHLKSYVIEPYSAGIETHGLNPLAVQVMAEAGVDISSHRSKHVNELKDVPFDCVVTVCGHAHEHCPVFPGRTRVMHAGFDDPPTLARAAGGEEQVLDIYRRVRDEIRVFVESLPDKLAHLQQEDFIMAPESKDSEEVRAKVREGYGQIAKAGGSCCGPAKSCCGSPDPAALAESVGYATSDLSTLPEGANMGLSCGNPTAIAELKPGEVVLDLGSGGGFDVFIAGRKVGATGRVIGVDMTPEMLSKARANIAAYRQNTGLGNVEFRLGEIEHLPVADNSVDVVISNCVINLSPDKAQVWREIARVLKPGGRVAVSDLALVRALPTEILEMVEALIGCVAGAVPIAETERMAREAGLTGIVLTQKPDYVNSMTEWQDPLYRKIVEHMPPDAKPGDFVTSLYVAARKPGA